MISGRVKLALAAGFASCLLLVSVQTTRAQQANFPVNLGIPDTILALSGCASPEAFVQIFDNNQPIDAVVAGADGRFSQLVKFASAQGGLHNIKFFFDDVNRRTSSVATINVNIAAQSTTPLNVLLPTTIEHEPEPIGVGNFLIFRGTTCPGALVNLTIDNNFTLAAQADSRGNWFIIADTEDYYVGAHVYHALSSVSGQISQPTHKYQFNVVGPSGGPEPQSDLSRPVITEPDDLFLSGTRQVTVRGTGPPNGQVELLVDDAVIGSVFVNIGGEWSFVFNMSGAEHTIRARTCAGSTCGESSEPVRIRFAGDLAQCTLALHLKRHRFYFVRPNGGIDLALEGLLGQTGSQLLVDWGDAEIENLTLGPESSFRLHHVYKAAGQFSGSLTLKESDNCFFTVYFSTLVTEGELDRLRVAIGGVSLVGLSFALRHWLSARKQKNTPPVSLPPPATGTDT